MIYGRICLPSIRRALLALLPIVVLTWSIACQPKVLSTAKIHIQNEDWEAATDELERAVDLYPENGEAHFLLGLTYGHHGRYEEMVSQFDRAAQISTEFESKIDTVRAGYWADEFTSGIKALDSQDYESGVKHLKAAILLDPAKNEAHAHLASAYVERDSIDKALGVYYDLLEKDPQNLEVLQSVSDLYYQQRRFEEAVEIYQRILARDPGRQHILHQVALSFDALGKHEEAATAFENAVSSYPQDVELIFSYGVHHYNGQRYPRAIALFQRVLEVKPDDFDAVSNIGNAYLSMAESARKELKQAINGPATAAAIQEMRGHAIAVYKKSIPYLQRALELNPNLPSLWRNLGVAYIQTGEKQRGEEAFLRSEELQINLSN